MKNEYGSAMLWIFIGIMLFAALGVAMMRGTRTSSNMITSEEAKTYAKQAISYALEVKQAVARMTFRGVKDTEFSFENSQFGTDVGSLRHPPNHNPNCTSDNCKVFSPSGGGINPTFLPEGAKTKETRTSPHIKSGGWSAWGISVQGVGTAENELIFVAEDIDLNVCLAINDIFGITNPGGLPPNINPAPASLYNGAYGNAGIIGDEYAELAGKTSYCYNVDPVPYDTYNFFTVLIAR